MISLNNILQWDVRSWSTALKYWEQKIDWKQQHQGLELGARQGGLSLWLADKGMQVTCTDLEHSEQSAKPFHDKFSFNGSIKYVDTDATALPFENQFDIVIFKSIIGGIGRNNDLQKQKAVFSGIYNSLKPGGYVLFAENLIASPMHRYFRKRFNRWGFYWRYITIEEMNEFLKPFEAVEIKTNGFSASFGRSEWQRNILALVDHYLLNHIIPNGWHYIVYGCARKPKSKH